MVWERLSIHADHGTVDISLFHCAFRLFLMNDCVFTCTVSFQPDTTPGHVMVQAARRATWVCARRIQTYSSNYRYQIYILERWERSPKGSEVRNCNEPKCQILNCWAFVCSTTCDRSSQTKLLVYVTAQAVPAIKLVTIKQINCILK